MLLYHILNFNMHIKSCFGGLLLEEAFESERNYCAVIPLISRLLKEVTDEGEAQSKTRGDEGLPFRPGEFT